GLFQSDRGPFRPGVWPWPVVAGVRTSAAANPAAAGGGRSRLGRGPAQRVAGAPLQTRYRGGQLGKDRRLWRGQGEEERIEEPRVSPRGPGEPARRTAEC